MSFLHGCVYFEYWKTVDIAVFWIHPVIGFFYEPLRAHNYMSMSGRILVNKLCYQRDKSFKEIYDSLYNKKREAKKRLEAMSERNKKYRPKDSNGASDSVIESDPILTPAVELSDIKEESEDFEDSAVVEESPIVEEPKTPQCTKTSGDVESQPEAEDSDNDDEKPQVGRFQKLMQRYRNMREPDPEAERLKEERRVAANILKEEKRRAADILREEKRKAAELARKEKKKKKYANMIDFLLTMIRFIAAFAIIFGNIRRYVFPANFRYVPPGESEFSALVEHYRVTTVIDIMMFVIKVVFVNCCQVKFLFNVGFKIFVIFGFLFLFVTIFFVMTPFVVMVQYTDISWCRIVTQN